ncbi:hypothetical protein Tco_1066129, partial [Tanacetum coccineum]
DILIRASRLKEVMEDKGKKSSMETFTPNDKADYYSGITSITVNGKNAYELKGKFLDDLHNNAFSGTNRKDAVEHIEYYLKIIDPIKLPNVDDDKLRIVVFPILLAGGARRWFDKTKESITCWVDLTAKFFGKYYPPSRIEGNNTLVIKWDPANPRFEALWDYWKMGGDEIEVSDDESSDLEKYWSDKEEETVEIFKIETDVFDYETPLCLYYAIASGEVPPKTKASVHKKKADSDTTPKEKPPTDPKDKRVKQTGKMTGSGKQKQPTTGLETLSDIALTETEQLKIAIKRSRIQTHSSQASGSGDGVDILSKVPDEQVHEKTGTDEGAGDKPEVPDVPEHHSNSEEESWTFSDGDDDDEDDDANKDLDAHDDDDDATESDDDGDNITHPKLSTFSTDDQEEQDDEEEQEDDDEDEEEISDQLVRTPSDYQTSDESEKQKDDDRVKNGEEDKEGDVTNVALEGGDVDMTEADTTEDTKDAHVTLTAATPVVQQQSSSVSDLVSKFISPTTDEGIDSILNPRTESTTLVNVPISVATETPATTTTIPPLLFPVTQSSQQTPVTTTTTTYPSTTPPPIPNFASLFGFNQRMKEVVDMAIQLKSNKLREEAQAENQEFLNSLDSNMQKYVTESLGAEVLICSTNQPQTSYRIASSLLEFEFKRILMDKIEENKSIDISDVQKNLYNALVEAYNTDKDLISSYGDVPIILRTWDDKDKDEEPSAGSN